MMNLFTSLAMFGCYMLFHLVVVNCAPAPNGAPKGITTTTKTSTTTSKSSSAVILSTTKISSTLSSTATYPTPTVPIGAGGGPFATVEGRMFQIQSKTQYFAGMTLNVTMPDVRK